MAAKKKHTERAPVAQKPGAVHQPAAGVDGRARPAAAADEAALGQLEHELRTTREDLQRTIAELASSNEELRASNEEIMSMNEELQSANEELEISRGQLRAVNNQLQEKVQELETANDDVANLLDCTDIATIFLDTAGRIKLFTPAATGLLNLIPADVGRPASHITTRFNDPELLADAQQVLRQLTAREKEVRTDDGSWWVRRILPYRTRDHRVDGVVITFVDITERKQAADAVLRHLAAIVESSADAILSCDLDGTIRTWNRAAERLYGYTRDEAVGREVTLIVPPDRTDEWTAIVHRLARGENVEQLETERLRKDGRHLPVALTASPLRDGDGRVVSAAVIARDITERQQAERALRESERRFRLMADAAPVMIWMSGTDRLCTWFNKSWLDFVGRTMEQELGNGWAANVHADDYVRCLAVYTAAFDARRPFSMEYRLRRQNGEYRWLLDSGLPLYGPDGNFTGYIGSCIDITERRHAEQALRDREERLQAILDTAMDAIITIDHRGIIQSANAATERMFGYSAAEMVGQNVTMLMSSPFREAHDGYIARYLRTGERHVVGVNREVEARRKDGSIIPTELAVSEIKHLRLFTGIHRDLTERKQLERDVVEAASLEQRRIGQDLHDTVAQELTALSILAADLVETVTADPARAPDLVARISQGLQRSQQELRAVLRGLLPVAVDSEGLMAALADLADRTKHEGKVACTFDCPRPVSVADNLSATHLYLIAQEGVYNAVKHSRARMVRIVLATDDGLQLRVQDDGIGMPAAATEHQGLGLRIMRSRAAIIGAKLTIEPAEPTGTVVRCVLPRKNP